MRQFNSNEDAAKIIAEALAERLTTPMQANDTHNGYKIKK